MEPKLSRGWEQYTPVCYGSNSDCHTSRLYCCGVNCW